MTPTERVAQYENELRAAQEVIGPILKNLRLAKNEVFRERHGYGVADWVLFKGKPAIVTSVKLESSVEYDGTSIRLLTKALTVSSVEKTLYPLFGDLGHVIPWPADRPKPEVKA